MLDLEDGGCEFI